MTFLAPRQVAIGARNEFLTRRDFLSLGLKALAWGGLSALVPAARPARAQGGWPNIIYIVIDTTRADHMSFLGYGRATTPNLDRLAAQSSVFTRAISPSNWTLPSFASLLSGKTPLNHNFNSPVLNNDKLSGTIAATLANQDYKTVSIQTNGMVERLDDEFQDTFHLEMEDPITIDGIAVGKARNWISNSGAAGPFFMFMGLYCPHQKYYPHDSFTAFVGDGLFEASPFSSIMDSPLAVPDELLLRSNDLSSQALAKLGLPKSGKFYGDSRIYQASYDSEINYSDEQIGLLLDDLKNMGLYDSSLIVVTADHGEMMDRGDMYFSHGLDFNLGQIHVPLIIKMPYQDRGQTFNNWISTMDISATILNYLGLESPGQEGVSLISLINGGGQDLSANDIVAYSDVYRMMDMNDSGLLSKRMLALIRSGFKFTKTVYELDEDKGKVAYSLYDLERDPREENDLSESQGDLLAQLKDYASSRYPTI